MVQEVNKSLLMAIYNLACQRLNLVLVSFFLPCIAYAEVTIGVSNIQGVYEPSKKGVYDQVLAEIQQQGLEFRVKYLPAARLYNDFLAKQIDCLSPSDQAITQYQIPIVQSTAINIAKAYIFWRTGEIPRPTLADLDGIVVGIKTGMKYGELFEKTDLKLERVVRLDLNYKKLMAKRIDAFIAYTPDVWGIFNNTILPGVSYSPEYPITTSYDAVVCHRTAGTEQFIERFNKNLNALIANGRLKSILGLSYNH